MKIESIYFKIHVTLDFVPQLDLNLSFFQSYKTLILISLQFDFKFLEKLY